MHVHVRSYGACLFLSLGPIYLHSSDSLSPDLSLDLQLRRSFVEGAAGVNALKRRFRLLGVLNLLVLPFSVGFLFIHFFLKHAEDFHSKRDDLGSRTCVK